MLEKKRRRRKGKRKGTQERKWADRRKECVPIRIAMFVGTECTHFQEESKKARANLPVTAFPQIFVSSSANQSERSLWPGSCGGTAVTCGSASKGKKNRVSTLASTRVSSLLPSQSFMSFGALAHDTTESRKKRYSSPRFLHVNRGNMYRKRGYHCASKRHLDKYAPVSALHATSRE